MRVCACVYVCACVRVIKLVGDGNTTTPRTQSWHTQRPKGGPNAFFSSLASKTRQKHVKTTLTCYQRTRIPLPDSHFPLPEQRVFDALLMHCSGGTFPDSEIPYPESKIPYPEQRTFNAFYSTHYQRTRITYPDSSIPCPEQRTFNALLMQYVKIKWVTHFHRRCCTQSPKSHTQTPKSHTQNNALLMHF